MQTECASQRDRIDRHATASIAANRIDRHANRIDRKRDRIDRKRDRIDRRANRIDRKRDVDRTSRRSPNHLQSHTYER
jgi:hypothetical protein